MENDIHYITSREGLKSALIEIFKDIGLLMPKTESHRDKPPLTRREACKYLNISLPTIDRLIDSGQLQAFNIGRQIRIKVEDIEAYVNNSMPIKKG